MFKSAFPQIMMISAVIGFYAPHTYAQEQTFDEIDFVQINAQNYQFGSPETQVGRLPFEAQFEMPLTHSFWISKFEITQAQWIEVMGYNPSVYQSLGPVEDYPVESITWDEVQIFVDRLNLIAGADYYRLPTEAEWEYVAKANTQTSWFFGDQLADLSTYAYTDNNPQPRAQGGKEPNGFGVYDLYGNLYEWVEDWYMIERDQDLGACPPSAGEFKVLRGGSNAINTRFLRSASRNFELPSRRSWRIGFRLVRVMDPATDLFRSGEPCNGQEGLDIINGMIFLANGNYIKCFGGLTTGANYIDCAYPLFNSTHYSQNPAENLMLGIHNSGEQYATGHTYVLDEIGARIGFRESRVVRMNEAGLGGLWQSTGTHENEHCYVDGEILNWKQSPVCNGGHNGGSNVMSSFRLYKDRPNNDCREGFDQEVYYIDADGDGHGDPERMIEGCDPFLVISALGDDCDDQNPELHPDAGELCNDIDEDCDSRIDEEPINSPTWYIDHDGDGFGTRVDAVVACESPGADYVASGSDCNDNDRNIGSCSTCAEALDRLGGQTGVYTLDPCGNGNPRDFYCDATTNGGGWTVGGWQQSSGTIYLGRSNTGEAGSDQWSRDLSCVGFTEIMVFNRTNGQSFTRSYGASTWMNGFETSGQNIAYGAAGTSFKLGTYGGGAVMGCVNYSYSGGVYPQYACDSDGQRTAQGHLAQYAGEYCAGGRLDGTWAWSDGQSCTLRGQNYSWGIAIR